MSRPATPRLNRSTDQPLTSLNPTTSHNVQIHSTYTEHSTVMESFDSSAPRPLAHIPSVPIFDPLEFDRSLPSSQYTLIKTDDLKIMYKEIGRVRTYLHNLIRHGGTTQSLVTDGSKDAKHAAAAVERVPPEILSMIFQQLIPPQNNNNLDPMEIPFDTDILLPGKICRSWRETTIATPSLWSSLYFNCDKQNNSVDRMVDMATTCIARAKNYPLFIYLKTWCTELARYRPIIAVLLACSNRWHNLFIHTGRGFRHTVPEVVKGAKGRLSMLRRLKVEYCNSWEWVAFDTFLTLPRLRIVDLRNATRQSWHEIGQFPLLPWRQLQQIAFHGHVRDAIELLQMSPSLQVFKTSIGGRCEGLQHVQHAFLRELSVTSLGDGAVMDFFGALTSPVLESLSYKSEGNRFPGNVIASFVKRSEVSQALQTLSLTLDTSLNFSINISDIVKCLASMPSLSQLSVNDESKRRYTMIKNYSGLDFHTGHIDSICEAILGNSMLPKLKQFSIKGPSGMSYVYLALLVWSRWRCAGDDLTRIESVEVNYSGPCKHAKSSMTHIPAYVESRESGWALALLRQYRSEGLRVVGPPVDEAECLECIEEYRFEP